MTMKQELNLRALRCWLVVVGTLAAGVVFAQDNENPFYININQAQPNRVYEVTSEVLALEYHDHYGEWKEMLLTVYSWQRVKVGEVKLSKQFGLNTYKIEMARLGGSFEINRVYHLLFQAENNQKIEVFLRRVDPPSGQEPVVNIMVNPIQFKCGGTLPNLVEYYGQFSGGRAPFRTQWFVLNADRNGFFYQPREDKIEAAGRTMMISVDKKPVYFVALYVTDACGKQGKKMVQIVCDQAGKNISTIFVEPLNKLPNENAAGKPN